MEEDISASDENSLLWHADFGDPALELEPLKAVARRLKLAEPEATAALENPEPGLLYLRGELPNKQAFEVYSVPSPARNGTRRLAVFVGPDIDEGVEAYFDSLDDAVAFLLTIKPSVDGP